MGCLAHNGALLLSVKHMQAMRSSVNTFCNYVRALVAAGLRTVPMRHQRRQHQIILDATHLMEVPKVHQQLPEYQPVCQPMQRTPAKACWGSLCAKSGVRCKMVIHKAPHEMYSCSTSRETSAAASLCCTAASRTSAAPPAPAFHHMQDSKKARGFNHTHKLCSEPHTPISPRKQILRPWAGCTCQPFTPPTAPPVPLSHLSPPLSSATPH